MTKTYIRYFLIVSAVLILFQLFGYYNVQLKVSGDSLDVISETIIYLENKRINEIRHTRMNHDEICNTLNSGLMSNKSRLLADISSTVQAMSTSLSDYDNAIRSKNPDESEEAMVRYQKWLLELEEQLSDKRSRSDSVENLWELGIFK